MVIRFIVVAVITLSLAALQHKGSGAVSVDTLESVFAEYIDAVESSTNESYLRDENTRAQWSHRLRAAANADPASDWSYAAWSAIGALDSQRKAWHDALDAWRHARDAAPTLDFKFVHFSDEYAALRALRDIGADEAMMAHIRDEMGAIVDEAGAYLLDPSRRAVIQSSRVLALRYLWLLQQEHDFFLAQGDLDSAATMAKMTGVFALTTTDEARAALGGWAPDDCFARAASAHAASGDVDAAVECLLLANAVPDAREPASFHALNVFPLLQGAEQRRDFYEAWTQRCPIDINSAELAIRYGRSIASIAYESRAEYVQQLNANAELLVNQYSAVVRAADTRYSTDRAAAGAPTSGWSASHYSSSLLDLLAKSCHVAGDDDGAVIAASELLDQYPDHPGCRWAEELLQSLP